MQTLEVPPERDPGLDAKVSELRLGLKRGFGRPTEPVVDQYRPVYPRRVRQPGMNRGRRPSKKTPQFHHPPTIRECRREMVQVIEFSPGQHRRHQPSRIHRAGIARINLPPACIKHRVAAQPLRGERSGVLGVNRGWHARRIPGLGSRRP